MHCRTSIHDDYHLEPLHVNSHGFKSSNFAYALSRPNTILLTRIFSNDKPFQANRIMLLYKLDNVEIEEENKIWKSHFGHHLYPSSPKEVTAYLFDDFADKPVQMRKAGAIISIALKQESVNKLKESFLSKYSFHMKRRKVNCKTRNLEFQILERVKSCLTAGIPYSSDLMANTLQTEYIKKFT